ncbi:hypothetical protein DV737_g5660, partial [Chaetothyriales sp. CBS 132003]
MKLQVRCNGNKTGCARCVEKKLSCIYSESRVGKVVGKRRKRPVEETAIGTVDSEAWIINNQKPLPYLAKRHCSDINWTSFLVDDAQQDEEYFNLDESTEVLQSIDLANQSSSPTATQLPFASGVGSQANVETGFARIAEFECDAFELESTAAAEFSVLLFFYRVHLHLLLKTANAAVRRLLHSPSRKRNMRKNYTCHMLLSSIMTMLIGICEDICLRQKQYKQAIDSHSSLKMLQTQASETAVLTSEVSKLLKRRPYDGFQTLGRHESHHVELDLRLQKF